jgi:hypothetical protein
MRLYSGLPAITLLALAQTLGGSTEATAQDMPPVAVGERVRVSTESGVTHVGEVTSLTSGALVLQGEEGSQRSSVPMASVMRLEVSRGQQSKAGLGYVVGAGVGVLGALAHCSGGNCQLFDNDFTPALAIIYGAGGGLVGALVGWSIKTDRWEGVPLDRLRVSLAPQRDGRFALGFSVGF